MVRRHAELRSRTGSRRPGALLNAWREDTRRGKSTIRIKASISSTRTHRIIPDRIEAGTFIIAAALTGGDLNVGMRSRALTPSCRSLPKTREDGVKADSVRVMAITRSQPPT